MSFQGKEHVEIRFGGLGGQGLVLASIILAEAFVMEGYNVIQGESHGIEARGGASRGEVIASKGEIQDLSVALPDIFVALSQEACDKYADQIKEESIVIVDSFMVQDIPEFKSSNVYTFPLTKVVKEELNTVLPANITFLGALVELSKVVSVENMKKSVLNRVPKGSEEVNMKAFDLGIKLAVDAKTLA